MSGSQSSATQLVGQYLASKGLPMTAENVRRALQMNAENPGLIPQLSNQAPPPPDAAPAARKAAPTQSKPAPQAQKLPTPPQPPQAQTQVTSDAAQRQPSAAPTAPAAPQQASEGSGIIQNLIQLLLAGGAGAAGGLAPRPSGGGAEFVGNSPMPPTGRMMDVPGGAVAGPGNAAQLGGPAQAQLPAPMKLLAEDHMPTPAMPPQAAQLPAPQAPAMPPGAAPASNVASRAPVSVVPREVGADAADLGGHLDWGKILGLVKRMHP